MQVPQQVLEARVGGNTKTRARDRLTGTFRIDKDKGMKRTGCRTRPNSKTRRERMASMKCI